MAEYTLKAKLIADASSLEKNFAKAQASLQDFNSRMKSIGGSISAVGSKLTSSITKPALLATSALAGITMVKGFNRLTGIDDARAKLKALRFDAAEVEDIMNSALESVKGTSYGLDEAATTAANAVAAGIKPGKDLTKYLTMTSDAAAIAGMSMSEMGSIINKVQTGQTAYTEDLEQLADRGLPIYQWLGEEAGVAAGEVKKLASDGQISSEMLFNAIEKNVGGAAKIIGENSFTAALANIGASISRIGANFLDAGGKGGGFFSQLKPLMADFNESLGTLEGKAAEMGEKFGAAFGEVVTKVQSLKDKFDALSPTAQSALLKTAAAGTVFAVGIGPALSVVGGGIEKVGAVATGLSGIFGGMKAPLGSFTDGMKALDKEMPSMKKSIGSLGEGFGFFKEYVGLSFSETMPILSGGLRDVASKLSGGKTAISTVLGEMGSNFKAAGSSIFGGFANTAKKIIPNSIQTLGSDIGGAFSAVLPNISTGLSGLGQSISKFGPMFLSSFSSLFKFGAIAGLVVAGFGLLQDNFGTQIQAFITNITSEESMEKLKGFGDKIVNALLGTQEGAFRQPGLIEKGAQLITSILEGITAALPQLLETGIQIISALVSGIGAQLPILIPAALNMVIALVTGLLGNIGQIIDAGIQLLIGLAEGLLAAIPDLIAAIPTIVYNLLNGILSNLPQLVNSGIELLVAVGTGLIQAIPQLLMMMPEIFGAIFNAFKEVDWLELGKNIVKGIIHGLGSLGSALWEAVKGLAQNIWDGITSFFSGGSNPAPSGGGADVPHFASGTKNFQGGFARINEGGRGELVVLPNGTQVIPHDVSMAYAQAAASAPTSSPTSSNLNTNVGLEITGTDSFSNDLLKGIAVEIDSEWSQVSASTTTQWQAIQTFLKTTWTAIKSDASSDWAALENMITSKWGAISNGTANSWNSILAYLRKTWQSMLSESLSSWTGMRDGVQSVLGGLYGVVTSGFSPSLRYIQGLSNTLYGYGTNMINELARGVRDTAGGVTGAIEDLVETLKSKFIEGFEIHSPSHFTYYVGTMLGKGLINSLRDSHLASFVDSMIAEMKNSFSQGKLNLSAVMSFMGDKAPDLLKELGITLGGGTGIMGAGGMVWPSDFTEITSWFGNRPYPGAGGSTNHGGLDIGASMGSNVYAALGGTITSSGWNGGYGNAITIDHGNGLSTLYGHMSQLIAGVGQMVAPGQVIGLVGSTGNSTGPHLHFETRMNGERMDPASFFGFSVGSRNVPQDMIAWVHKHEAIIPADEMEKLKRLTNPRAPYRNSHGDILPGLNTRFANSARGYSNFVEEGTGGTKQTIYQEININQPVESPSEAARAFKRAQKELAYGF
ncbi:peptidoglycan DD-metalloendopeptidase family protein [Eubacterium callanderi]|uniref:peptidoglycan DD-metalloendopeptidase family protein n=1 Tax=Eubacterium callanderi TaxID=53442 RepID=UPI003AB597D3